MRIGRTFPPQWYEPNRFGMERSLGAEPPQVILPLPTLRMQTVTVALAIKPRASRARRVQRTLGAPVVIRPLPTLLMQTVKVVAAATLKTREVTRRRFPQNGFFSTPNGLDRFVGSTPPRAVFPVWVAPDLSVSLIAVARRIAEQQKRPHWDLASPVVLANPPPSAEVVVTLATRPSRLSPLRATSYALGSPAALQVFAGPEVFLARTPAQSRRGFVRLAGPTVIGPALIVRPVSVTLAVFARTSRTERRTQRTLGAPVAIAPAPLARPAQVALAEHRRLEARPVLSPPAVTGVAPPVVTRVEVVTVRARPRHTVTLLGEPTVLRTFFGPKVTTAQIRPRRTVQILRAPVVVLPMPSQDAQTIKVACTAVRNRASALYRRAQRTLGAPVVVTVTSAALARATPIATTEARPRRAISLLRRPVVVAAPAALGTRPVSLTLVRSRRPQAHSKLSLPTVVTTPAPPLVTTITVRLAAVKARSNALYRRVQRTLASPSVVSSSVSVVAAPLDVTLARFQRRTSGSKLAKPVVVNPFVPPAPPVSTAIDTTLVAVQRRVAALNRRAQHTLGAPQALNAVAGPPGPPVEITLARTRPRKTIGILKRPAVVGPFVPPAPPVSPVIETSLVAVQRRVSAKNRRVQHTLGSPIDAPPAPAGAPVDTTILVSLTKIRFRDWRYWVEKFLWSPMVVNPPVPVETTISVTTVAIRARLPFPRSAVRRPTVVAAPAPPLARPISVSLTAVARRRSEWKRWVEHRLFTPAVVNPAVLARPIDVTLAQVSRPRTRSFLRSPAVVIPVPLAEPTTVATTRIRPPGVRSVLRLPVPIKPPDRSQLVLRISLAVEAILGRRKGRWKLSLPTVVAPAPLPKQDQRTIGVHLQVQSRTERPRRAPHFVLGEPTIIKPPHQPVHFRCEPPTGNWIAGKPGGAWSVLRPVGNWISGKPGP